MIYNVFYPSARLSDIVDHYWYSKIDLTEPLVQQYPTPLLQGMAFNFQKKPEKHSYNNTTLLLDQQAYLFGQPLSSRVITSNENGVDLLGVKFRPLGISRLTGINMEHIADQIIAASEIWGNEVELLCDEMQSAPGLAQTVEVLENFLFRKYLSTTLHSRADNVQKAIEVIKGSRGTLPVKTIQLLTNTSRKTLERAFMHYLGIKPKLYSGIIRFNAIKQIMDQTPDLSVSDIAFGLEYYDNSHLAASFKRFSGLTPTDYMETIKMERLKNAHFREHEATLSPSSCSKE